MVTHSNTSFKNLNSAVQTILSKRFGGEVHLGKRENIHPQSLYRFNVLILQTRKFLKKNLTRGNLYVILNIVKLNDYVNKR